MFLPVHQLLRSSVGGQTQRQELPSLSVESIKTSGSSIWMSIVDHAQTSIDNAQENWKSLLPHNSADSSSSGHRGVGMSDSFDLDPLLQESEDHFGALWCSASPTFGPSDVRALLLVTRLFGYKPTGKSHQDPSNIRNGGRSVNIFTTACLPWMTGTAINPLLRAHYLASPEEDRQVTLYVPWLSKSDQAIVYPHKLSFDSPEEQERYVRSWVTERTGESTKHFSISWYPGRYAPEKGSILPVGDITRVRTASYSCVTLNAMRNKIFDGVPEHAVPLQHNRSSAALEAHLVWVPEHQTDIAVLEEPEHLTWYHHGNRWTDRFRHVVGVMHTNYLDYARREEGGALKALLLRAVNSCVCRIHTHKVIKLSDAVQDLPRQCTQFVHGVSPKFLEVGAAKARAARHAADMAEAAIKRPLAWMQQPAESDSKTSESQVWPQGAYFLGKIVWAKGYTELLDLLEKHQAKGNAPVSMDIYGSGADKEEVENRAKTSNLPLKFHGAKDHADTSLHNYKVFVNPSLSDVVATTTAEALAMGKFVICAEHPSNAFFSTFRNCITYRTPDEFSAKLNYALTHSPSPMTPIELERLTWHGATERFIEAVAMKPEQQPGWGERTMDNVIAAAHNALTGVEMLRINAGAGANTLKNPLKVTDYTPALTDVGGFFDNHERAANARSTPPQSQPDRLPTTSVPASKRV